LFKHYGPKPKPASRIVNANVHCLTPVAASTGYGPD
jgi:hypothetical protein